MTDTAYQFLSLDFPPLLTSLCAAVSCAVLGNFLVLRRLSLMGDAIAHSVLPGIVISFLVSGSRATFPVFIGAAVTGIVSAVLVELIHRFGRLDTGAAMGVVFSVLFASGVLLMEQAAARNIDLDADCLLHGQLETIFWYPPKSWGEVLSWSTLGMLPSEVITSGVVLLLVAAFVSVLFKELTFATFDRELATALGFHPGALHYVLMTAVALAVVASFEVVGSILVIAMIICPATTARLWTDRLRMQIALSVVFAAISAVAGYIFGAFGPFALGMSNSVNASGMMTVVAGMLLFGSALVSPRYGIFAGLGRLRGDGIKPPAGGAA